MDAPVPEDRLHVVVGVIADSRGRLLIQQRRPGTPKAGQWEFPGGKVEPGESPGFALARELEEELGIEDAVSTPLAKIMHDYDHARVWLDTRLVTSFHGQARGREGQSVAWVHVEEIPRFDVLEAVHPILAAYRRTSCGQEEDGSGGSRTG